MDNRPVRIGDKIAVKIANWHGHGWAMVREGFTVREKNGRLGIDYNTEHSPYTSRGDVFVPLSSFSGTTVCFENMETGEVFHYDNVTESVVEGLPELYRE